MRSDLNWTYATAGAMNTANSIGYLFGSLIATSVGRKVGLRQSFLGGMIGCSLALGLTAASSNTVALLIFRILAGVFAAVVFVAGATIVTNLGSGRASRGAAAIAVYLSGVGLGIAASGLLIPALDALAGQPEWRLEWLALAALSVAVLPAAWLGARLANVEPAGPAAMKNFPIRSVGPLLVAYTLFGAGYIGYMTFIVAYLHPQFEADNLEVSAFWFILGLAGMVAPLAWSPIVDILSPRVGTSALISAVALATTIPLLWPGKLGAIVSAVLFGGSFLAAITAITAAVRKLLPPQYWAAAVGVLTTGFAFGQCAGPVLSGIVSDAPGGLSSGLSVSAGILTFAAILALTQRSDSRASSQISDVTTETT